MKIWVCYTEDRTGSDIDVTAHRTEEGAKKRLYDYIIGECEMHGIETPDMQDKDALNEWLSEREYHCWVTALEVKED